MVVVKVKLPEEGIRRLEDLTRTWDTRVILYLRRPGDFLSSSFRQHIKTGKRSGIVDEFLAERKAMWGEE